MADITTTAIRKPARPEVIDLLLQRRSLSAGKMMAPGPTAQELETILHCALRVPDHGKLTPWRISVWQGAARERLGQRWREIFHAKNPDAAEEVLAFEAARPTRAPLLLVVSTHIESERKPRWEQVLSGAAVCQNAIIAANALGYFAQWLTGWVAYDVDAAAAAGVLPPDEVLGYIYIGSGQEVPEERSRPQLEDIVTFHNDEA